MKQNIPHTPFSTRLSRSAKEAELRIQNIVQGPKKRPPIPLMVLTALLILLCGNLVSCQSHPLVGPDVPGASSAASSAPEHEDAPSSHPPEEMSQWWNGSYYTRVYNPLLSSSYSDYTAIGTPIEALLDGLTVQSLPTHLTDINNPHLSWSWNNCVWLLAEDQQADVSLYGVAVSEGTPQNGQSFQTGGIILRHGSNWAYCPEFWNCWYGAVPSLSVRDWDGDGASEAAVISPQGMGVGIWTSGLVIFELDDLSYTRPDYNQFTDTIVVNYDEEDGNLLVSLGDAACTIPVKDILWDGQSWGGEDGINLIELGSWHEYYFFNGRGITAWLGLDISGWTRGWLCADLTFDGANYVFDNILLLEGEDINSLTIDGVSAEFSVYPENMAAEDIILQMTYGLSDLEVSLWRDGYSSPAGPGMIDIPFFGTDSFVSAEILDSWEPIYHDGDYWFLDNYKDFTALRYHSAAEDKDHIYAIDTTRTDLSTYRGIQVGSSRAEVLAAYPDIFDTPYWNDPDGDYLWYCDNEEGWGAAILFFFQDNTVSRIVLNNMFD